MAICMFCQKTGENQTINVYVPYDNNNHKVVDDITKFLEHDVELYIQKNDRVCYGCKNVLQNIAKLKDRLWRFISLYKNNPNLEPQPFYLYKFDETSTSPVRSDDEDSTDVELVEELYSEPYKPQLEKELENIQRQNSLSRESYLSSCGSSPPKLQEKRHKRSASETFIRTNRKTPEFRRTRSALSSLDKSKDKKEKIYPCGVKDCTLYFVELDNLIAHKIEYHKEITFYPCDQCDKSYMEKKHLDIHSLEHDNVSLFCFMCGSEQQTRKKLQQHFDRHLDKCIPCLYCDKSFVCRGDHLDHVKKNHSIREKEIRCKKSRSRIYMRIGEDNNESVIDDRPERSFTVIDLAKNSIEVEPADDDD